MIKWGDDDDDKKGFGRRWGTDRVAGKEGPKDDSAKIEELIRRAEPMIEQVNNLYSQYIAGVERLPPVERRKQLEQLMAQLQSTPKPNSTYSFRANTLQTHYTTLRDRWEKLMKDVESGKIKRQIKR